MSLIVDHGRKAAVVAMAAAAMAADTSAADTSLAVMVGSVATPRRRSWRRRPWRRTLRRRPWWGQSQRLRQAGRMESLCREAIGAEDIRHGRGTTASGPSAATNLASLAVTCLGPAPKPQADLGGLNIEFACLAPETRRLSNVFKKFFSDVLDSAPKAASREKTRLWQIFF